MREKVNIPLLSVLVPVVKLFDTFLITTDAPLTGSLLLLDTNPFTTLVFTCAINGGEQKKIRESMAKHATVDLKRLNLIAVVLANQ
jgi:hypothetical protein